MSLTRCLIQGRIHSLAAHLYGWFGSFCPKILFLWWRPMNAVCCSLKVNGVVILLAGGRNTSTLHYIIKIVSTFCDLGCWLHKNLVYNALAPFTPTLSPLAPTLAPLTCHAPTLAPNHTLAPRGVRSARGVRGMRVARGVRGARGVRSAIRLVKLSLPNIFIRNHVHQLNKSE